MSELATKELPDGWKLCKLGDVMRLKNGYAFKSNDYSESGTPLIRISDLKDGVVNLDKAVYIPDGLVNEQFIVETGDLLIAMSGATTGKIGVYKGVNPALQNQRVGNFKIIDESVVDRKYRDYYISSLRKDIEGAAYGGAQPNISAKGIEEFKFPFAPPEQQKRIVAKIEELFSHIDAGIEALKKAKQLLKQYRQSVLKAAVTGELTKEWREANKDKLEPTAQLLERILKERREKWEERQLEQFKAKGKMSKDDMWKEKYIEPEAYESGGYEIPESWVMARAEQVCEFITKGTTPKKDKLSAGKGNVPFIKVYNLAFDTRLNFDVDPTFTDTATHEGFLARSKVYPGDVLMNIVGPPLGKVSIVSDLYSEWNINQAIAIYRPIEGLNNKLLAYFLLSKPVVEWMLRKTKTTAGQVNLTLEISRNAPIPLMAEEEQLEIVRLIDEKLGMSDRLLEELEIQNVRAEKNKQSILAFAFCGRLTREAAVPLNVISAGAE